MGCVITAETVTMVSDSRPNTIWMVGTPAGKSALLT